MKASSTVCVLGGTGFVGQRLASALVRRGYRVRIPTRNRERHRSLLVLPGVELVNADIHDAATLSRLVAGCGTVINLVGILHERPRNGSGFHKAHVTLVEKTLEACLEHGVERFLQMSALKASAEHGPSHYLRSKGAGERVVKNLAGEGIRFTIFQPSAIFGPADSFTNMFAGLVRLFPVLPLVKPDARLAPVFVGDVANAFCAALEDPSTAGKTYQLCGPDILSLREIVAEIAKALGKRRLIIGLPDTLASVQAWLMDYVVPGRILSVDSFKSLTVASVCTENGLEALGIRATAMRDLLPSYLGTDPGQRTLSGFRQSANR
ncbi:MAG: complex I NDUFA9 subunit family protein [Gammaproteobacteria bacterium]|nr:complex I NDUFA9 subunit family protein [Gammaproteobacteria bacterium]MDH3508390.1 complex I NDUFA9 subunit family protein [Gammaproteobacteria bacterium]